MLQPFIHGDTTEIRQQLLLLLLFMPLDGHL
jgi:hypothetical protein